jgi:hypothetical protein
MRKTNAVPVTPGTLFRIGGVTQTVTGAETVSVLSTRLAELFVRAVRSSSGRFLTILGRPHRQRRSGANR